MSHLKRITGRTRSPDVLDNQVRVSTPENISFQYEIVGPSRRLVAYLLDVFITLVAFLLAVLITGLLFGLLNGMVQGTVLGTVIELLRQFAVTVFLVGAFLSMWFYGAWMEAHYNGQTFGKKLVSIRALSADGSAIDATQATLRNFFRLLDVSPFLPLSLLFGAEAGVVGIPIFGFGLLCMTISPKYQRLGDFVANTIVVSESKKWTYSLAEFQDRRVAELANLIPDDFVVAPGLARALAEYVDRRRVLSFARVNEVAKHISRLLTGRFELGSDTDPDLLLCALYYRTFLREVEHDENPFLHEMTTPPIDAVDSVDSARSVNSISSPAQPVVAEEMEAAR